MLETGNCPSSATNRSIGHGFNTIHTHKRPTQLKHNHVRVDLNSEGAAMKYLLMTFVKDEDGAVTVDWVVLTAAVVALGVAAAATMTAGTTSLSDSIWEYMDSLDLFS